MLYLATKLREVDFSALMGVYEEGNRENGALLYPELPEGQQLLRAEQSFHQYLKEVFFFFLSQCLLQSLIVKGDLK